MKIDPMVQLKHLVDSGALVYIERTGLPSEYEVTVYNVRHHADHGHYGGDTLTEAVNRAWKAFTTWSAVPQSGDD